jgi:hypothetical protein
MSTPTQSSRTDTHSTAARREYDDGNPGTVVTGRGALAERRAGDWAQDRADTYYDDGEAATISA